MDLEGKMTQKETVSETKGIMKKRTVTSVRVINNSSRSQETIKV